jgi:hypothetical protein
VQPKYGKDEEHFCAEQQRIVAELRRQVAEKALRAENSA